ncbi:hypothetical protein [Leptospira vanthielii]|uniref:hypothetical protein n=1 Tax=Leptospira vanthielii TaxID=293085 RepID=UPI0002D8690E|nr:hypothetical protein [Leptospira vanthielii]
MEIHLQEFINHIHLFNLIGEGKLRSYCGLESIPDYSQKNLKNIFYNQPELEHYVNNSESIFCDICKIKLSK